MVHFFAILCAPSSSAPPAQEEAASGGDNLWGEESRGNMCLEPEASCQSRLGEGWGNCEYKHHRALLKLLLFTSGIFKLQDLRALSSLSPNPASKYMLEQDSGMKRSSCCLPPDRGFHGKVTQTQGPERSQCHVSEYGPEYGPGPVNGSYPGVVQRSAPALGRCIQTYSRNI